MKKLWFFTLSLFLTFSMYAEDLPSPYNRIEVLPFLEHGWYSHAAFFEKTIKHNHVKTVIEVGSWLGASTRHIAKCLPQDGVVYAVDHWLGSEEHQEGRPGWHPILPNLYEQFLSNVIWEGLTSKIVPIRMDSVTAAAVLPKQADIVYIDGANDFESVYHDLKVWFPHVKPGGILCGDDWGYLPVYEAVQRFAKEEHLDVDLDSGVYVLRKKKHVSELSFEEAKKELKFQYDVHCQRPSDINEHLPTLRRIAKECSSVAELGVRNVVSSWGMLLGLTENPSFSHRYLGVDLGYPEPHVYELLEGLAIRNGVDFQFWQANDMDIEIEPVDLLFIDTLHIYAHLTYELEKFSPKARKYIAMHDTSQTFEYRDCTSYTGNYSEYPAWINRAKHGLWPAVLDFLSRHPEWKLFERHENNNGLTVLKRIGGKIE